MEKQEIRIAEKSYPLIIYYENRSSVRASIGKNGVIMRIPLALNKVDQYKAINKLKEWAIKKLQESPPKREEKREYKNGEVLKIGNREYILSIELKDKRSSSARILDNKINLSISGSLAQEERRKNISSLVSRVIGAKFHDYVKEKIHSLNKLHFNQPINKIFLKNTSSRWGSCSSNNNINISTRLLFAPDDVLTYVCIHELAHLIEKNHYPQFWALVEKAMPDYKDKIGWLKEHGYTCIF